MRRRFRNGFTLLDLCILVAVLAVLLALLLPLISRAGRSEPRIKCASNLRQIGMGLQMYANDNKGKFPRTTYNAAASAPTEYSAWHMTQPFAASGPRPNDVTAALFLVLRTQDLSPEVFVCPSSSAERWDYAGRTAQHVSNFPSRQFLSYSYANMYSTPQVLELGHKLNLVDRQA